MSHKSLILSVLATASLLGAGFTTTAIVMASPAAAQSSSAKAIVDAAIAKGIVGETIGGYLALTSGSATPEITNAMNEVNIGRKSVYTRLARQQNVQIDVIATLTGEKQIASSARGTKILNKQGVWVTVR